MDWATFRATFFRDKSTAHFSAKIRWVTFLGIFLSITHPVALTTMSMYVQSASLLECKLSHRLIGSLKRSVLLW
jgi:hypothetical protein